MPAISINGVGKEYRLGVKMHNTLRDQIVSWFGKGKQEENDSFWALRDVSFEVNTGEVIGVIGRNGAGKSTLLKILSQITDPTEGEIRMRGRVASLLEVGTGFHPELSGRENIFLNGAILGMGRREIRAKFDEIVAFAEVEKFIDTPVKHYSSGMYVRLAFAVSAHLEPEILIVDEVLAVGDSAFQRKCLGKMSTVAAGGRTVIFVSHNMDAVQKLCERCVFLKSGRLVMDGDTNQVLTAYLQSIPKDGSAKYRVQSLPAEADAVLLEAEILGQTGTVVENLKFGEPFSVRMLWEYRSALPEISISVRCYDGADRLLFGANTLQVDLPIKCAGRHEVHCVFPRNSLVPGEYFVGLGSYIRPHRTVHEVKSCLRFVVTEMPAEGHPSFDIVGNPLFAPLSEWEVI